MSLDKFLDLLLNQRLIFNPIKMMSDQNEVRWILDTIDANNERHRQGAEKYVEAILKNYFISCWTKNDNEKISLWRHYLGKDGIGVAIQSKVDNFYKHVYWDEQSFSLQEVLYKKELKFEDIEKGQLHFTKNIAYKDEEELRVLTSFNFMRFDEKLEKPVFFEPPNFMSINIEPEKFISGIMISPFCANWQTEIIKQMTHKLAPNLTDRFKISSINEKN